MSNLNRALKSVGKTSFVEYFNDYKNITENKNRITVEERKRLAEKLLENNPKASKMSGQYARISAAITIFKNGWGNQALKEVIDSKHPAVTAEIKKKARELLTGND